METLPSTELRGRKDFIPLLMAEAPILTVKRKDITTGSLRTAFKGIF